VLSVSAGGAIQQAVQSDRPYSEQRHDRSDYESEAEVAWTASAV